MSEKKNILLNTDIGTDIDDAVALYLAMNSNVIDLKGVYVTNGPVFERGKIARHMLDLGKHDAALAIGESTALNTLIDQYTTGAEWHMVPKNKSFENRMEKDWLSLMANQLKQHTGTIIASIAPLTNIAILLEKMPDIASKIKTLYIMGGRKGEKEHNFTHDSLAAKRVLASNLDIVIVSADICKGYKLDISLLTMLQGSPLQKHLGLQASYWKTYNDSIALFRNPFEPELAGFFRGRIPTREGLGLFDKFSVQIKKLNRPKNFRDDPPGYLETFKETILWCMDHPEIWTAQEFIAHANKVGISNVFVSDAFVIYALEHPERVSEERVAVSCDDEGKMSLQAGGSHRLVVDVDYKHFAEYLKKGLEKKPETVKTRKKQLRGV